MASRLNFIIILIVVCSKLGFTQCGTCALCDTSQWAANKVGTQQKQASAEEINEPKTFSLSQNYPNPFNPTTTITYTLPQNGIVTIKVYDVLGREVATLLDNEYILVGSHSVMWNGKTSYGKPVASGIYLYTIRFNNQMIVKKMLMLK